MSAVLRSPRRWGSVKRIGADEISWPVGRSRSEPEAREGHDGRRIGFTQIAGLVARRIVGFVKVGDIVAVGQRVGLIRFGSRVDVFLPEGCVPQVALGQRAIAGETVLGRFGGASVTGVAQ